MLSPGADLFCSLVPPLMYSLHSHYKITGKEWDNGTEETVVLPQCKDNNGKLQSTYKKEDRVEHVWSSALD